MGEEMPNFADLDLAKPAVLCIFRLGFYQSSLNTSEIKALSLLSFRMFSPGSLDPMCKDKIPWQWECVVEGGSHVMKGRRKSGE